jgi:predicted metal-dependent TIM-barrel fold hydrolase
MKYGEGGSLFQIAVAAIEMTILIKSTRNDPTSAFRAFPKSVEIAKESDMAVLIHTKRRRIIGPGDMETISRRNIAPTMRKIIIDMVAERRKST